MKNGGKRECTDACPRRDDRISVLCIRRILQVDFFRTWKVEPRQYKKNRCSISQKQIKKMVVAELVVFSFFLFRWRGSCFFYCNLFCILFTKRQSASDNITIRYTLAQFAHLKESIRSRIHMLLFIMLILSFILFCWCSSADIHILVNKIEREISFSQDITTYYFTLSPELFHAKFSENFHLSFHCKTIL